MLSRADEPPRSRKHGAEVPPFGDSGFAVFDRSGVAGWVRAPAPEPKAIVNPSARQVNLNMASSLVVRLFGQVECRRSAPQSSLPPYGRWIGFIRIVAIRFQAAPSVVNCPPISH